ncbi:hypothetical protein MHB50_18895 [Siminovitchia sp. FSL H7-0308]|uniref:Uncharacterized protein n=1 Tax=Siminovitchia thermophila TaxID=1245522 RepID=A0ABS2RAB9_9BACI|nr:hypothetical protein [Siminovitchia thermophila]MBM7716598.1 hypothetical protein [Siminovitchia thermophila]ONK21511.1 hypothetical protein BLX87_21920 [Bacillus sp. VT-16-64]
MAINNNHLFEVSPIPGVHPHLSLLTTIFRYHQQHFGKMKQVTLSEPLLFGLASGPGFFYKKRSNHCLVLGSHSFDLLQDLATSTGTWINRRFSLSGKHAIREMKNYLSIWKAPILVTVPLHVFPQAKCDEEEALRTTLDEPATKCIVTAINDELVQCYIHTKNIPLYLRVELFERILNKYCHRWADIIFPSNDISLHWLYGHSIDRHIQRSTGWSGYGTPHEHMRAFFYDAAHHPAELSIEAVLLSAETLGGDFGRTWYGQFLQEANKHIESSYVEEAAKLYKLAATYWKKILKDLEMSMVDTDSIENMMEIETLAVEKLAKRKKKAGGCHVCQHKISLPT